MINYAKLSVVVIMLFIVSYLHAVTLNYDKNYFNPFATSIKYDIAIPDHEENILWDVTFSIINNDESKPFGIKTFNNVKLIKSSSLYFFVQNESKSYSVNIYITGEKKSGHGYTIANGNLKGHLMQIPPKKVLEVGKKQLLFTVKPCLRDWMVVSKQGFEDIYFGLYSGKIEVNWSCYIEFQKSKAVQKEKL